MAVSNVAQVIGSSNAMRMRRSRDGRVVRGPVSDATARYAQSLRDRGIPLQRRVGKPSGPRRIVGSAGVARRVAGTARRASGSKGLRYFATGGAAPGGSDAVVNVRQASAVPMRAAPRSIDSAASRAMTLAYGLSGDDEEFGKFKLGKVFKKLTKGIGKVASVAAPIVAGSFIPGVGGLVAGASGARAAAPSDSGSIWDTILKAGGDAVRQVLKSAGGGGEVPTQGPPTLPKAGTIGVGALAAGAVVLYLLTRRR